MKTTKFILTVLAFVFAIVGAVASNNYFLTAPYYGDDPATSECIECDIQQSSCSPFGTFRCTCRLPSEVIVPAWDDLVTPTTCATPLYFD